MGSRCPLASRQDAGYSGCYELAIGEELGGMASMRILNGGYPYLFVHILLVLLTMEVDFQHLIEQPEALVEGIDLAVIMLCILPND